MAKEWYRKETWSTADELDFFAHLKRARSNYNKAQYLRIQACHLQSTTDEALARAAIKLAEKCVTDYPEEGSEIALCYLFMAESYSTLNEVKSATDAYLKCFDAQRRFPRHGTNAANSFAMFVIERDLTDLFEHAASALVEFNTHLSMPFEIYEHYGSLAIFAATEGILNEAKTFAQLAIDAADKTHSGLWKHPNVGLVEDQSSNFRKRIELILDS